MNLTTRPNSSAGVIRSLKKAEISASTIGRVLKDRRRRIMRRRDGRTEKLAIPKQDPFWPAFFKGLGE